MSRFCAPFLALFAVACTSAVAHAQHAQLEPLTTFGTNGWLAPGSIAQLTTDNNQRGLGVNPVTGNLILPSRSSGLGNNVWVINGQTGAVGATPLTPPSGGYAGGTFVINMAGVGADGGVYVANLSTSAASAFKVYSWPSEVSTDPATVAFNAAVSQVNRIGDSFAVFGSGASTVWAAAGNNNSGAAPNAPNSTFSVGTTNGTNTQTTYTGVPGTSTAPTGNGYRLGIAFVDADTLIGTQGGEVYTTNFDGSTATAQAGLTSAAQRPLAYLDHLGQAIMATIDTNSSQVSLYNISNPTNPVLFATGNNTSGALTGNVNGVGGIGWGPSLGGDQYLLYAMSTNQGIQAFVATVPEPATWAILAAGGVGAVGLLRRHRRREAGTRLADATTRHSA